MSKVKFLDDVHLLTGTQLQIGDNSTFSLSGDNLVINNSVGDIVIGDGTSDIYVGDGTSSVDILFEQSGAIKAEDGSSNVTLTLGSSDTSLSLVSPSITGSSTINNKLTFTTANGYILFDYEPSGDTGEYSTEVPLIKVDRSGEESTILARVSEYRAVVLGIDDTVWLRAGDTNSVIKSNVNLATEQVLMSAEGGFIAYGFPGNDTTWSNRNEFQFRSDSTTASDNGLYIGDGGKTQFIDLSRNLKNIGTVTASGKISGGEIEGTSLDINGNADISGDLTGVDHITASGTVTANQINLDSIGDYITFYGGGETNHSITSRQLDGGTGDDIRVNTYGSFIVNLDSNDNQGTAANSSFFVGRHGGNASAISGTNLLFQIDGQTGNVLPGADSTHDLGTSSNRWANVYADTLYGDGSNITGITASNADTVDNLHAASFLRSDTSDTGTGTITLASSSTADNPLILGSSSQTDYTLQQWQTSAHGTNKAYILAYGAGHGSQAGNFAVKNIITDGEIFFELASGVEPLRMTSTGATFAGNVMPSTDGGATLGVGSPTNLRWGGIELSNGAGIQWTNGDARIIEGLVNNYSLSFQTYNGSALSTALRLDGDNTATFGGAVTINTDTIPGLIVKNNSNSGKDASIVIRGARNNPSAGVNPAKLILQSYDSDAGSGTNVTGGEFYMEATNLTGGSLTDFEVGVRYRKDGNLIDGFNIHDGTFTVNGNISVSGNIVMSNNATVDGVDISEIISCPNWVPTTNPNYLTDYTVTESDVTQHVDAIDHDSLLNFEANEHIDWTTNQGSTNIHTGNYNNTQLSDSEVIAAIVASTSISGTDKSTIRSNIGAGTSNLSLGTTSGTALEGDTVIPSGNQIIDWTQDYSATDQIDAANIPNLAAGKITSGTFANGRIAESNVTQHQAALSITESQISDLGSYITGLDFSALGAKGSGTGNYSTSGYLEAGRGSGGVALTHNDGYGNANVTFNHVSGTPEQAGSSGRIVVTTDSTTAKMSFELKDNVSNGTAVNTPSAMEVNTSGVYIVGVLNLGDSSDTTLSRHSSGNVSIEGNKIWHAGGLAFGYSENGKNYPVELDGSNNAYVNVPWTDNDTVYDHPTHPGDDISIDTGALTGATVISDLDFNVTTDTLGHVTDANATIATRNLTAANIGAASSSHTHDDRYYTESEIQTFFNRGYISRHHETNLAVGWYTIATNTGDRALGEFQIWDTASSDHQSVLFNASHHFGTNSSNDITVLANSRYSGTNFRYIRIKENSTYDGAALQVYVDGTSNSCSVAIVGGNAQESGWVIKDWIADATDPGDVSGWASFTESCKVDLDNVIDGGIITTGEVYAGGATTQYKAFHDNYHPNADTWTTARTITLGGDLSGSVSINGSANVTLTATVANDSHSHSNYITSNANDNVTGHTEWQDGYHVRLGNGADMRLYHTSGNNYIDCHTGNLYIRTNASSDVGGDIHLRPKASENGIIVKDDAEVELYYNNAMKLTTDAGGISVTGVVMASGNIGNLDATNDVGQQLEYGSADVATLRCDANRWRVYMGGSGNSQETLTVAETGRVGINDSTPDYTLDVNGNVSNISIYASHDVAAYSDVRVKTDIKTIPNALDKVNKLRGVTFKRTDEGSTDKRMMGVIAQEVLDIIPEVVNQRESDGHYSVSYGNMVGVLIEAVKELKAEVEELKNKLNNGN